MGAGEIRLNPHDVSESVGSNRAGEGWMKSVQFIFKLFVIFEKK